MTKRNKRSIPARASEGGPHERSARRGGRWRRIAPLLLVVLAVSLAIVATLFAISRLGSSSGPKEARAAIVDQLAMTDPNPAFVRATTHTLEDAGYVVDYYPSEEVTVDFYRQLPTLHYEMVILRAHVARFRTRDLIVTDDVSIFTGEPYGETEHFAEMDAGFVGRGRFFESDPPEYFFTIRQKFVESEMKGKFDSATVIIMGCDGLRSDDMAKAFLSKGAKVVIGWNTGVSAARTDDSTERLLRHLVIDGLDAQRAAASTMLEVGPDPADGSVLQVYPREEAVSAVR